MKNISRPLKRSVDDNAYEEYPTEVAEENED